MNRNPNDHDHDDDRRRDAVDVAGLYLILLVVVAIIALVPLRNPELDMAALAVATKQEITASHPTEAALKASRGAPTDAGGR
jgi:hypothetical protein